MCDLRMRLTLEAGVLSDRDGVPQRVLVGLLLVGRLNDRERPAAMPVMVQHGGGMERGRTHNEGKTTQAIDCAYADS